MPGKWSTNRGLVSTAAEGIADRGPDPDCVVGVEEPVIVGVVVVLDVVVVKLGADEDMAPNVEAYACAEMLHEVIGAGVVGIASIRGARGVEAHVASADAAHQVKAYSLAQVRLVEEVEVGQNGAIVQPGFVDTLGSQPGGFDVNAELLDGKHVAAEVEIRAAAHRRVGAVGGRGRFKRAAAEKDIDLLGRGKLGKEQEQGD